MNIKNCGPYEYWDDSRGSCVYSGRSTVCEPYNYWDDSVGACVYGGNSGIDCGPNNYWDTMTNSCVYNGTGATCGPNEYWDMKIDACVYDDYYTKIKPTEGNIIYTPIDDNFQGPGGCRNKEECDAYCTDTANMNECIDFSVKEGHMDSEEAEVVRMMAEKNIIQGPGGCQSKEGCDKYCDNPNNTKECVDFAVKVGFMSEDEAERIMKGGPGGCQGKEQCDAYCEDDANRDECNSFIREDDMFRKEGSRMVSPKEIKTVLAKVKEPAKCETEIECKIYCSSADANQELCRIFSSTVIVESKVRSITEFVDEEKIVKILSQEAGPGGNKNIKDINAYCSNPVNDLECQNFISDKKLLDEQTFDDRKEEIKEKRLEKEKMFTERVGARIHKDTDGDGISDYDELNIFYTDPNKGDTDEDGILDGNELIYGKDPLFASIEDQPTATGTTVVSVVKDKIVYEDPKIAGEEKPELLAVAKKINVLETEQNEDGKLKAKKIAFEGTAPANSFVTLYIYSTPIIVTVKTDENGNWNYVLDKELENGNHEIQVAITDNAGKIFAKSSPLPFVKEAEAVGFGEGLLTENVDTELSVFGGKYLYFIALLIVLIIGWALIFTGGKQVKVEEQINNK